MTGASERLIESCNWSFFACVTLSIPSSRREERAYMRVQFWLVLTQSRLLLETLQGSHAEVPILSMVNRHMSNERS